MRYWAISCFIVAWLTPAPAMAQPGFAAAFKRLDRNSDGLLSVEEFRLEGADFSDYLEPAGIYRTRDGLGVEIWRTPFGVLALSMPVANIEVSAAQRARAFPGDRTPHLRPHLMVGASSEFRFMTLDQFERDLGRSAAERMKWDLNGDGGISADEIREGFARNDMLRADARGLGETDLEELAMRAKKLELELDDIARWDRDADDLVTIDELLNGWLASLVKAFAPPEDRKPT